MTLDKKAGELKRAKSHLRPVLNDDLIKEEEKFDGYYAIVTSELDMKDTDVVDTYKGL